MGNFDQSVRTRFAPSPTGFVHIGSLRTALFSFLFAKKNKGSHILRIEDTDQNRLVSGAVENLLKVMSEVGIGFDEGYFLKPDGSLEEKGDYGPYLQSKRLEIYQKYALQLVEEKKAYFCFCSSERLDELRKEQVALKKPPMYDRHCRNLTAKEIEKKQAEFKALGKNPVIRFAIPLEGETVHNDLIFGVVKYQNQILDDQVILKSDGFPTYHLAVVVDDHHMKITHVIRGEEWLPSTPKHLLIANALGFQPAQYAHLPLILNPDKSKLSKRQGDVAVEDFLSKGYLKDALINFVAFLGWNPKTEQEIFSMDELMENFDLEKINKAPAVFDQNKLDWMNSQYIKTMNPSKLTNELLPYWLKYWEANHLNFDKTVLPHEYFEQIANLEKERLKKLSEIGERTTYFFVRPKVDPKLMVWKKSTAESTKKVLNELAEFFKTLDTAKFSKANLETELKSFIEKNGYDNGSVLWPLRYALTGQEKSPGPFEVASVLLFGQGKQEIIDRLIQAATEL